MLGVNQQKIIFVIYFLLIIVADKTEGRFAKRVSQVLDPAKRGNIRKPVLRSGKMVRVKDILHLPDGRIPQDWREDEVKNIAKIGGDYGLTAY